MRRETQYLIMLLLGGAVLKISLNGMYTRYVKPSLGPWLAAAGAAAVLLAVALIVRSLRTRTAEAPAHQHATWMAWLLMVPALTLLFAPPPVLTMDQPVAQADTAPVETSSGYPPLPPGPARMNVLDFVGRALGSPQSLADREVTLVGFVRNLPDGAYLARVFIWCCVADARAAVVKLDLSTSLPGPFTDKQWVQVVGTYVSDSVRSDPDGIPTMRVAEAAPIPEPSDPYER